LNSTATAAAEAVDSSSVNIKTALVVATASSMDRTFFTSSPYAEYTRHPGEVSDFGPGA